MRCFHAIFCVMGGSVQDVASSMSTLPFHGHPQIYGRLLHDALPFGQPVGITVATLVVGSTRSETPELSGHLHLSAHRCRTTYPLSPRFVDCPPSSRRPFSSPYASQLMSQNSQCIPEPDFLPFESADPTETVVAQVEPDQAPGTLNAPIALTENSSQVYGHAPKDFASRYKRFAQEGRKYILGPMPVRDFLDTFCYIEFPSDYSMENMPTTKGAFATVPRAGDTESVIYDPLVHLHRMFKCHFNEPYSSIPSMQSTGMGSLDAQASYSETLPIMQTRKETRR